MPQFVVESFELHAQKYRVEAETPAEAIVNFYLGDGDEIGSSEVIEMSREHGLLVDGNPELVDGLTALGQKIDNDIIAGILDVEEIADATIP